MRTVLLGNTGMRSSALGFGCSAVLGRAGRRASLAALGAAYDAGITFFDTARSYGYGESEALLGEFLRGRRDSVIVSTKFGIVPARTNLLKEAIKPVARKILRLIPGARRAVRKQIAAQFSANNFTVPVLRSSLETSLRKLQTDHVDLLFLHSAPESVLQQDDLFAALEQLVAEGKVRRFGISSHPDVIEAALDAGMRTVQFPCNLFDPGIEQKLSGYGSDLIAIANHPFGGVQRISECKRLLTALAQADETPAALREKLSPLDDAVLADIVLNAITRDTAIQVVIPSMMQLAHIRANVAAMEHSRFTSEDLRWLRGAIAVLLKV